MAGAAGAAAAAGAAFTVGAAAGAGPCVQNDPTTNATNKSHVFKLTIHKLLFLYFLYFIFLRRAPGTAVHAAPRARAAGPSPGAWAPQYCHYLLLLLLLFLIFALLLWLLLEYIIIIIIIIITIIIIIIIIIRFISCFIIINAATFYYKQKAFPRRRGQGRCSALVSLVLLNY